MNDWSMHGRDPEPESASIFGHWISRSADDAHRRRSDGHPGESVAEARRARATVETRLRDGE